MALSVKHHTQASGTDAGSGEIHKAQWNESHDLTGAANNLLGFDGSGNALEYTAGAARTLLAVYSSAQVDAGFQPLSANLTSWAAVAPGSYLTTAAAAAAYQPLDSDLTTWAGLTPSANAQTLVGHTFAQMRTDLGLVIGTNVQAWDADLDTWATLTPSANAQTLVGHTFAQMRTDLGLVIGTNVQAWDADLDTYAGITPSANAQTLLAQTFVQMTADFSAVVGDSGSGGTKGLAPAPAAADAAAQKFLKADGTWANPNLPYVPAAISANWLLLSETQGLFVTGMAFTNGVIYFHPVVFRKSVTFSDLGARVITTNAGNFALGLYANNPATGRPTGNALAVTGNMSAASSTTVTADITGANVAFTPNIYWAAFWADNSVAALSAQNNSTVALMSQIIGSATTTNALAAATSQSGVSSPHAYNASSWPDVTSDTFTELIAGVRVYAMIAKAA